MSIQLPELHPGDPVRDVGVTLCIHSQTEKAMLVSAPGEIMTNPKVWLPKSQASVIHHVRDSCYHMIKLPAWLYRRVRPQLCGEQ